MWSYSGNPANSPLDAVRFWLQDTDSDQPLMGDAEIAYVISQADPIYGSPIATAALCADILVAHFAQMVDISADGVSVSVGNLGQKFRDLAQALRATYSRLAGVGAQPIALGTSILDCADFDVKPLPFKLDMHDNPRAGAQEFNHGGDAYVPDSGYWTGA